MNSREDGKTDGNMKDTLSFVNRLDLNIGAYQISDYHDDIHHGIYPLVRTNTFKTQPVQYSQSH